MDIDIHMPTNRGSKFAVNVFKPRQQCFPTENSKAAAVDLFRVRFSNYMALFCQVAQSFLHIRIVVW